MRLKRGFSMIELIVVIGTLAVLGSILLPTLSSSLGVARRARCAANLRSQHSLLLLYMDGAGGGWLPRATVYMDFNRGLVEPFAVLEVPEELYVCPQDAREGNYANEYGTSYLYPPYAAFSLIPRAANPRALVTNWFMNDPYSVLFQDTFAFHSGKRQLAHPDGSVN